MKRLARASARSIKANLVPGVVLQCFGLALLAAYFWAPAAAGVFDAIGAAKQRYGLAFSAVSTGLFGGLIPFLYLRWSGKIGRDTWRRDLAFYLGFWAWKGMEVDLLYRFQAELFGAVATPGVIVRKVLVDQFVYCPLWSAPMTAVLFKWKDLGYSWPAVGRVWRSLASFEIPVVQISIWIVWIPATAIIYALPLPLQIPLFNLALCFFVLIVNALGEKETTGVAAAKT